VLALGKRCDEEIFDERDLEVLNTIAQQASLALVNVAQAKTLRDLYQADIERVEAQRTRLARELHDQLLNELAQLKLGVALHLEGRLSPESFLTRCDAFIADIRRLIGGLRPAMLDYGLGPALQAWANDLAGRDTGLRVKVDLEDDQTRYDPRVEMYLYRIVQQAGENTVKHAHAQTLTIHGQLAAKGVNLEITDDGQGFEARGQLRMAPLVADKHFGLAGMFERAAIIGADLRLDSAPGYGTCLHLIWRAKK